MFLHTFGGRAISRTCLNIRKGSDGKSFFFMFLRPFGLIPKCSEFNPNGTGSGRKLVTTGPPQVHTHSFDRYLWLTFFGPPRQPVASTEQTRMCHIFIHNWTSKQICSIRYTLYSICVHYMLDFQEMIVFKTQKQPKRSATEGG